MQLTLYLTLCSLPDAVSSGVIEVISPSPHYYPDLSNLKETFGDPKERVRLEIHLLYKCNLK